MHTHKESPQCRNYVTLLGAAIAAPLAEELAEEELHVLRSELTQRLGALPHRPLEHKLLLLLQLEDALLD